MVALLCSHYAFYPTHLSDIIGSLVTEILHLMVPAGEYKDILSRGLLVIFSVTERSSPLRQILMQCLVTEYISCDDQEMRWWLYWMLEEGALNTGWICDNVGREMEKLFEMGDVLMGKLWERIYVSGVE